MILEDILQAYVNQLEVLEIQKFQIEKKILDLQFQLVEIQKQLDETMRLKNDLAKELK